MSKTLHVTAKLFLFLISFCLSANAFAQQQIKWGPSYKIKGNAEMYKFLGILGDSYYYIHKPNEENIVQRFNFDHQLIGEQKFDFIRNRQRLAIHGSVQTTAGSYVYAHQFSKKYKEWIMHVSQIVDGKIQDPQEAYFQEIDISNSRLNKAIRQFEFDFGPVDRGLLLSEDSTKVAFVNIIPGNDFNEDDAITIAVFDEYLKLIWKEVFFYDFGDNRYGIEQAVVTNSGDIYLVGTKDRNDREKSSRKKDKRIDENEGRLPNYDYYLYNINQQGILESRIDLGAGLAPVDVALFFPDRYTDQFLMAGFYTDDEHRNRIKGIFFTYGDENFQKTDIKLHEFSETFLTGLVSGKNIEKGRGLAATFEIMDIMNYRDGTIGFIAENNYVRDFSQTDIYGRWFNRTVFISDEIIIPKFDSEGNLLNIQKIAKDFSSENINYTSYAMAVHNGKTFLLFNDYKSGRERKEIGKSGSRFTDLVILDELGRFIGAQTLFSDREIPFEFNPYLSDFNQNIFLIGSKQGGRFSMATLEFNQ